MFTAVDERRHGIAHFFVGLGSIGKTTARRRLYELALSHQLRPIHVIHPQVVISPSTELGLGITIMAGAVINACASLGANVIVNTGAIVEHDCIIGDHVHIATGARLTSTVCVGEGTHIGTGATIKQCITIGKGAIVGAGVVVVKDVLPHTIVVGMPAKPLS